MAAFDGLDAATPCHSTRAITRAQAKRMRDTTQGYAGAIACVASARGLRVPGGRHGMRACRHSWRH